MNEQELRELLKLIRGIEHFVERCLKTEQTRKQVEAQGIEVTEATEYINIFADEKGWQL